MKNSKIIPFAILLIFTLPCFISCEELFIREEYENNALDVFHSLWTTVDENYTFFTAKNIDWDSVYTVSRPLVSDGMRSDSLFNVLADMLSALRDGHVNLQAGFDLSRYWEWYLNYPQNFNFSLIERNYLGDNYQISGPFYHRMIDSIGYVYYESFEDNVSESIVDYLVTLYSSRVNNNNDTTIVKGLIIDVRDNGGGKINNAETIASRFTTEKKLVQYWQYKDGPEHDNFTKPIPKYLEPGGEFQYRGLVVVLTNRSCYSATNFFAQIMKSLGNNIVILGDSTGGGGGLPVNRELPNGWVYRFSSTVTTTLTGENIEFGIAPDIKVEMKEEDLEQGKDSFIEAALQLIDENFDRNRQGS